MPPSLIPVAVTTVLFFIYGDRWFTDTGHRVVFNVLFLWLFVVIIWAAFTVVSHAECLAVKIGELSSRGLSLRPYTPGPQ